MISIIGTIAVNGQLWWHVWESMPWEREEDGVVISFSFSNQVNRRECLQRIAATLVHNSITWLKPFTLPTDEWLIDLNMLKESFEKLSAYEWLTGTVKITPEYDVVEEKRFNRPHTEKQLRFIITPKELEAAMIHTDFPELEPFIKNFQVDHPDPKHCAFLMMKYEKSSLHDRIIKVIRETCSRYGMDALRADDKSYADDLLPNVRTYMHGCGFGITVFERLMENDFNPNVSLEVGYLMAQGKHICLLKDLTLPSLHTDLIGRLYETFDTQNPEETIPLVLERWLKNKGLV